MSTDQYPEGSAWTGWVIFAGFVLIVVGCINAIQGLVAIFKHTVYVLPSSQLVVTTDYKAWGWTLLIWGIIMALAGLGLFSGKRLGAVVRDLRGVHQPDRPVRLVPGLPLVEHGRDRAGHLHPVCPDGSLAGGAVGAAQLAR